MATSIPIIKLIVIHCAATKNGYQLNNKNGTAVKQINDWHQQRGFLRSAPYVNEFNPELKHIGYQFVIDCDGACETGRLIGETGAHVAGHNSRSIGICLVGTDKFTVNQWSRLRDLIIELRKQHPDAKIVGHRDLSPDLNGDGKITSNEYTKICPGFTVADWLANNMQPPHNHVIG